MIRKIDAGYIQSIQPAIEIDQESTQNTEQAPAPVQQIVQAKQISSGPNAYAARMGFDPSSFLQYTWLGQLKEQLNLEPVPPTILPEVTIQGTNPSNPSSNLEVKREHLPYIEAEPVVELPPLEIVPGRDKPHLFVKDPNDAHEVDINDIDQGQIGDCFILASIGAVARHNPEMIKRMIRDNHDGTYTVTFKQGDTFAYVTVNDKFPGGPESGQHADPGDATRYGKKEIWPLVLEKAYAEYWAGGYAKIANGGSPSQVLDALVGGRSTRIRPGIDNNFEAIKQDFDAGRPYVFSTPDYLTSVSITPLPGGETHTFDPATYGLVADHAYTLNKMYRDASGKQWVELYNPWGTNHPKPIPFDEIQSYFPSVIRGGARAEG
jgi:hypothetical protein